ncbi:hypothetical protein RND71_039877 [Anisodus tanguticus]|uniref:Uncharacterized protein n=1 Tax=Anisodus tanguticus TaxID=243964 RepID=A0AAE1QXN4_9SOLA|nr:hypothetical protein RND71_039877 [Anisodus tanguticus]
MSLDLRMGEGVTFISDMQKGLIAAIMRVLPESRLRFCVKHRSKLVMNMLNENEAEATGWGMEYSLKTMFLYNQFMRIAQKRRVNGSANNGFEVTEGQRLRGQEKRNEAVSRPGHLSQTRKGRLMSRTTCGEPGHNSRGCAKHSKGKQLIGKTKCRPRKKQRNLVDEPTEDVQTPYVPDLGHCISQPNFFQLIQFPANSSHARSSIATTKRQCSSRPIGITACSDFEYPDFEVEDNIATRTRSFSEAKTRFQLRQLQSTQAATR